MHPNHLMHTAKTGSLMTNFFSTQEAKDISECTFQPYVSETSRKLSSTRRLLPGESVQSVLVTNQ